MNTRQNDGDELLQPLPLSERIEEEMVIGVYPLSEVGSTATVNLLSRESLLKGTGLMVPGIEGNQLTNPRLVKRISKQLAKLLGGWFAQDITPYIELRDSLISQQVEDYYRRGGMTIQREKSQSAFYYLAFQVASWLIQAAGELNVFHCISLGRLLSQDQALQSGGQPSFRPLGSITPFISQATPNIKLHQLTDYSEEHPMNVFDTFLSDAGLTIKAGVRMHLKEGKTVNDNGLPFHYGIRINLDLRHS